MRARTSLIWKMPREEFVLLVQNATDGVKGILSAFSLPNKGGNYKTLRRRAMEEGLDWKILAKQWHKVSLDHVHDCSKKPLSSLMVENSTYNRGSLKRRLLEDGLLEEKCSRCGQGSVWMGERLVFVLDHINGISDDNRIENLRMLCPQCNSQMSTFAGRNNKGKTRSEKNVCKDCGATILKLSIRCRKCADVLRRRRVVRPDLASLRKEVDEMGWEATGRRYGVSGNAIRKWFYKGEMQR